MALFGNILGGIKNVAATIAAPVTGLVRGAVDISRGQANISQAVSPIQPVVTSFPTTGSGFQRTAPASTFQRTIPASTFQRTQPGFDLQKTIKGTELQPAAPPGTPFVPTPPPAPVFPTTGGIQPPAVVKTTGDTGPTGTDSGQFDDGTETIPGGAGLLPGSLTSSFRSAGTGGLINLLTEEEKKRGVLIKFAGSPDLFDPNEGMYVSKEAVNEQFKVTGRPIEFIETDVLRPGITSEADFGRLSQEVNGVRTVQPLSATEMAAIKPAEIPTDVTDIDRYKNGLTNDTATNIFDKLTEMQEAGVTTVKELRDKIKESDDLYAKTRKDLSDLNLLSAAEITDIMNSNIPKTLANRRAIMAAGQVPGSERWLAMMALTNTLTYAKDNRQSLIDVFNLNRTITQDNFNNYTKMVDLLKPDNVSYQSDESGNVWAVYYNTLTGKIDKYPTGVKGESKKKYAEAGVTKDANDNIVGYTVDKDGNFKWTPTGGSVTSGGGKAIAGINDLNSLQEVLNLKGVSDLAKSVIAGTINLKDLTPTKKAAVAAELTKIGFNPITYLNRKLDNLLGLYQAVPEKYKGLIQGNVPFTAKVSPDVAKFESAKTFITIETARLREVGVLTDADYQRYNSAMPARNDRNYDVAKAKVDGVKAATAQGLSNSATQQTDYPVGSKVVTKEGKTFTKQADGSWK